MSLFCRVSVVGVAVTGGLVGVAVELTYTLTIDQLLK